MNDSPFIHQNLNSNMTAILFSSIFTQHSSEVLQDGKFSFHQVTLEKFYCFGRKTVSFRVGQHKKTSFIFNNLLKNFTSLKSTYFSYLKGTSTNILIWAMTPSDSVLCMNCRSFDRNKRCMIQLWQLIRQLKIRQYQPRTKLLTVLNNQFHT